LVHGGLTTQLPCPGRRELHKKLNKNVHYYLFDNSNVFKWRVVRKVNDDLQWLLLAYMPHELLTFKTVIAFIALIFAKLNWNQCHLFLFMTTWKNIEIKWTPITITITITINQQIKLLMKIAVQYYKMTCTKKLSSKHINN